MIAMKDFVTQRQQHFHKNNQPPEAMISVQLGYDAVSLGNRCLTYQDR
jgi:hypothetical protein